MRRATIALLIAALLGLTAGPALGAKPKPPTKQQIRAYNAVQDAVNARVLHRIRTGDVRQVHNIAGLLIDGMNDYDRAWSADIVLYSNHSWSTGQEGFYISPDYLTTYSYTYDQGEAEITYNIMCSDWTIIPTPASRYVARTRALRKALRDNRTSTLAPRATGVTALLKSVASRTRKLGGKATATVTRGNLCTTFAFTATTAEQNITVTQ